jgi:SAM-dependent methyltransferase
MADATDSKSVSREGVGVRVPSPASHKRSTGINLIPVDLFILLLEIKLLHASRAGAHFLCCVLEPKRVRIILHNVMSRGFTWKEGEELNYLDMLTKLGVGNAHPGGFAQTLQLLHKHPLQAGSKVLEVGCGTGRTACFLAEKGCKVTAVDIRPDMLVKARTRSERLHTDVLFVEGDACNLPFTDNEFDVVMVESVTNFTDTRKALSEYQRVLKDGGVLYDREVIKWGEMPSEVYRKICGFYGVLSLHTVEEWQEHLLTQGFANVRFDDKHPFPPNMWEDTVYHPDPISLADEKSILDPEIWQLSLEYDSIIERFQKYLGYAVLIGNKIDRD